MFLWTSVKMSFIFELILDIFHFQESCTWMIDQGQPRCTWSHLIEIYGHDITEHVPTCQTKLNWFVASMDVSLHKRIFFNFNFFLKYCRIFDNNTRPKKFAGRGDWNGKSMITIIFLSCFFLGKSNDKIFKKI